MRVVFYSGYSDSFTDQVGRDIAMALNESVEFIHVTARKNGKVSIPHTLSEDGMLMCAHPALLAQLGETTFSNSDFRLDPIVGKTRSGRAGAFLILKIIQPDAVLVWNGKMHRRGDFAEAALKSRVPVFFLEKGVFSGSWVLDPQGVNASASYVGRIFDKPLTDEDWSDFNQRLRSALLKGESAWSQPRRKETKRLKKKLKISDKSKIIFFPGQVDNDSNILLFSPCFSSVEAALKWVVEGAVSNEVVLFKPHPKSTKSISPRFFRNYSNCVCVKNTNIWDLIDISDAVITVNSTAGVEAALVGKKVLFLGQSILSGIISDCLRDFDKSENERLNLLLNLTRKAEQGTDSIGKVRTFLANINKFHYSYLGDHNRTRNLLDRWVLLKPEQRENEKRFSLFELESLMYKPTPQLMIERLHLSDLLSLFGWKLFCLVKKVCLSANNSL